MAEIYVIAYSHDWNEGHVVKRTRKSAIEFLDEELEVTTDLDEDEEMELDSSSWWRAANEAYENGKWKSLQLIRIDTVSLESKVIEGPDA